MQEWGRGPRGSRQYLNGSQTRDLVRGLDQYFQSKVKIPKIRIRDRQETETLISEETMLFARYLRNERQSWNPRTASVT